MRVVHNLGVVTVGLGFSRVLYLTALLLLARFLGVEKFGQFSEAFAFAALFFNLLDFGFSSIVTRELAGKHENLEIGLFLRDFIIAKFLVVLCSAIVVYFVASALFDSVALYWLIAIFFFSFVSNSYQVLVDGVYYALHRPGKPVFFAVLQRGIFLALAPAFAWYLGSPIIAALLFAFSHIAATVYALYTLNHEFQFFQRAKRPFAYHRFSFQRLFREGFGLAVLGLITSAYARIDMVLLGRIAGEGSVGIYAGAFRIFEIFLFLGMVYRIVIYPIAGELRDKDPQKLALLVTQTIRLALLLLVPLSASLVVLSPLLTHYFLGHEFVASGTILPILILALPFAIVNNTLFFIIIALKDDLRVLLFASAALVVNVILNIVLIPQYGALAPALVTVVTEMLMFAFLITRLFNLAFFKLSFVALPKILFVILLTSVVLFLSIPLSPVIAVATYLVVFIFFVWYLDIPNSFEYRALSSVFERLTKLKILK
jgi:O-antigen/teichoic acid export membrane protein